MKKSIIAIIIMITTTINTTKAKPPSEKEIFCERISFITEECEKMQNCNQVKDIQKQIKINTDISDSLLKYCYINCIKKYYPENIQKDINKEIKNYMEKECGKNQK